MSEEIKTENNAEQVPAQAQTENTSVKGEAQESSPDIKSESNQENWKKFREDRDRDRKARIEAERVADQKRQEADALKAAMESLLNKDSGVSSTENVETEEDVIEKKVQAALAKERQKLEAEAIKREAALLPQKLVQAYPDFEKVCNEENMDYLEYHYPEIASAIKHVPHGFDRWSMIYKNVKRFVPVDLKEDKNRMAENAMKPKTSIPNLTDTAPKAAPWILTEERKRANWERMQKDQKHVG